jgi:hypothetical protein
LEEDAIVRDCRGIERMAVMYNVGIIHYSVNVLRGGHRDSKGKGRERRGR